MKTCKPKEFSVKAGDSEFCFDGKDLHIFQNGGEILLSKAQTRRLYQALSRIYKD